MNQFNSLKSAITLGLILVLNGFSSAQNWEIIKDKDVLNYSIDSINITSTIWVDSVKSNNNGDTTYYLSRAAIKCEDCQVDFYYENFYFTDSSSFLGNRLVVNAQNYYLITNYDTLIINSHAALGDLWLFNPKSNIMAEVIEIKEKVIFNITDSIKIVHLSNNDTLILSKNYGIIQLPLKNNKNVYLLGSELNNKGLVTPTFQSIFDFNIGDTFVYENSDKDNHIFRLEETLKYAIVNKFISNDSIAYIVNGKAKKYLNILSVGPPETTYFSFTDTLIYTNNTFFNSKHNEQVVKSNNTDIYKPTIISIDDTFKCVKKGVPYCEYKELGDSMIYGTRGFPGPYFSDFSYGKGFGLLESYYYEYRYNPYPWETKKKLVGCIKNGEVFGSIYPDSLFNSVGEIASLNAPLSIYPNPFQNEINFEIGAPLTLIRIVDVFGKVIIESNSFNLKDEKQTINTTSLSPGVYLFEVYKNDGSHTTQKLIKQ